MSDEILESSGAAEGAPSDVGATTSESPPRDPSGQPIEIDSLDRYRYKGQSLKDWESGHMRQQDYTSKTQQIAQERKFHDNLSADLDRVKSNPQLAEQFRSIYPEKFHAYLRYVLDNSAPDPQRQNGGTPANQYARLDPSMEMRINQLEQTFRQKEVAAISAELDSKFRTLTQKYPFADEEAVVSRAQALLAKMKEMDPLNQNPTISDKQWDLLWKSQHDRAYGLSDAQYKKQVKAQIEAGRKGSDSGAGGGIPGQAPRQFRSIKEATNQALADIEAGSF